MAAGVRKERRREREEGKKGSRNKEGRKRGEGGRGEGRRGEANVYRSRSGVLNNPGNIDVSRFILQIVEHDDRVDGFPPN